MPEKNRGEKERKRFIELLLNLLMSKLPKLPRKEIEKMVEPLLSDIKKSRAYREIAEEVEQELTPKIEQKVRSKQAKEIARMLLSKKMSLEFIVEVTGLSSKEARALRRELAASKN